jgi:hypothetical protein
MSPVVGKALERANLADNAAYQCHVLLAKALDELSGVKDESAFLARALVSRAHALALAANVLLSYDEIDGETTVAKAESEVLHG